jgi:hypothetical protein
MANVKPASPTGPISHLTHRLVEVKRFRKQLNAKQKALHGTLRLAHLRGGCLHLLVRSTEGWQDHRDRGGVNRRAIATPIRSMRKNIFFH